ncbi:DUF1707 domain-containing protein [Micromonospora sp. NPDC048871]|uniref:DUF1707 SHOCT-like domain-containing protein n=1 Tax=unclassified Micromonospora TaxID=2617518 RepID=UPI002E1352A8
MEGRDGLRAGDSDRQAIAERLRVALDEGRLNLHEYDERLQRAYAARSYADLDALVRDLPAAGVEAPVPAQRGSAVSVSPAGRQVTGRWLAHVWESWLQAVGIVVAIWALTSLAAGDLLYFWPGWVAGPWGALLLVETLTGLVKGEPRRWAAEQEQRRQRRAAKKALKRQRKAADGQQALDQPALDETEVGAEGPERKGDPGYPAAGPDRLPLRAFPERET